MQEGIIVDLSTLYQDFFGTKPKRPKYILPFLKGHYWQQQIDTMLTQRRVAQVVVTTPVLIVIET